MGVFVRNLKGSGKVYIEGRDEGKNGHVLLLLQLRELVRCVTFTRI